MHCVTGREAADTGEPIKQKCIIIAGTDKLKSVESSCYEHSYWQE